MQFSPLIPRLNVSLSTKIVYTLTDKLNHHKIDGLAITTGRVNV